MALDRDHDPDYPWRCWIGGVHAGRYSTRKAAMNSVDRPWRRGHAEIRHTGNGERWERRRGSWFKTDEAQRRPKQTPAILPENIETVASQAKDGQDQKWSRPDCAGGAAPKP